MGMPDKKISIITQLHKNSWKKNFIRAKAKQDITTNQERVPRNQRRETRDTGAKKAHKEPRGRRRKKKKDIQGLGHKK